MRIIDCGRSNSDVIILLHGAGLSWWQYKKAAKLLSSRYHVVMPVLDGHPGSNRNFSSTESNAREIISYIDRHYGGSVLMICGMSLGGQILLEMLSVRKDICRYAIIESTPLLPMKIKKILSVPIAGIRKIIPDWDVLARADYRHRKLDPSLFKNYIRNSSAMTMKNYSSVLSALSDYEIKDTLAQTEASVYITAGDREDWLVKGSAVLLNVLLRSSARLTIYPDYHFGDLSINNPEEYVRLINEITGKR